MGDQVPFVDLQRQHAGLAEELSEALRPVPIHLEKAYADLKRGPGSFAVAEGLAGGIISLRMFPEMTEEQIQRVAGASGEFFHELGDAAPTARH